MALNQETEFIEEVSGLTEKGEIQETAQTDSITQSIAMDQTYSQGRFKIISNRGRGQARGRGGRPFTRHTGENDPYDMSIAPLNSTRIK